MGSLKTYLYNAVIIIKEYAEFEDDDAFWKYIQQELGLDESLLNDLKADYERYGWRI